MLAIKQSLIYFSVGRWVGHFIFIKFPCKIIFSFCLDSPNLHTFNKAKSILQIHTEISTSTWDLCQLGKKLHNFNEKLRSDYDEMIIASIHLDPDAIGDYANFLSVQKKNYEAAEKMYLSALEVDPKQAKQHCSPATYKYAKTLAEAFLDESKLPALEKQARWKKLTPLNPQYITSEGKEEFPL